MKTHLKKMLILAGSFFILYLGIRYWDNAVSILRILLGASVPLFTGFVIAYIVNLLMKFYERHLFPHCSKKGWIHHKRGVCITLAFITFFLIFALLTLLMLPQLINCMEVLFDSLANSLPKWIEEVQNNERLSPLLIELQENLPATEEQWHKALQDTSKWLLGGMGGVNGVMNMVISTTSSLFSGIFTFAISLIFCVHMLHGKERWLRIIRNLSERVMGRRRTEKARGIVQVVNDCFHSYLTGQCLEALLLGSLCAGGMFILRLPYALMIGALVAVTALIPVVGAFIGGGVGMIMIFTVSPIKSIIFLIFLLTLQWIENNLIYPRTVGATMQLPGMLVLAAVTLGGGFFGVMGMIVAVPLTAVAYRLTKEYVRVTSPKA